MNTSFEIIQGDTKEIRVSCYYSNGDPVYLESAESIAFALARYGQQSGSAIVSKSYAEGNIDIQNVNEAVIYLTSEDTNSLVGKYEYTFTVTDRSAQARTFSFRNTLLAKKSNLI